MMTRRKYAFHLALVLLLAATVAACGGGGGGGGITPLYLGTVSTSLTHTGSIAAFGSDFYSFTTGTISGTYTISLTNTQSDLSWALADPAFTAPTFVCDMFAPGPNDEICSVALTAGATYYLVVDEWDTVAGTYTLTITPPGAPGIPVSPGPTNEGSAASPLSLGTVSTFLTHTGSVGAFGTSFYTFTTGSTTGTYTISLTNTHSDLRWEFATDSTFTAPAFICDNHVTSGANNEICPYTLTAATTYYMAVDEWDNVAGTFTLSIATP